MQSIYRQTKVLPDLLQDLPQLPEAGAHVWGYFLELSQDRFGPMGAQRITPAMLRDFEWLHGIKLELWERQALRKIDAVFFANMPKAKK